MNKPINVLLQTYSVRGGETLDSGSAGPLLIAAASQFGGQSIGVGLAVMIAICCPAGALFLLLGLGAMREAMAEAERVEPVNASHTGAHPEMSSS